MPKKTQTMRRRPGRPQESLSAAHARRFRASVRAACTEAKVKLGDLVGDEEERDRDWLDYVMRESGRNGSAQKLSVRNAREVLGLMEACGIADRRIAGIQLSVPPIREWFESPGALAVPPGEGATAAAWLARRVHQAAPSLRKATITTIERVLRSDLERREAFFATSEAKELRKWGEGPRCDALRFAGMPRKKLRAPTVDDIARWDDPLGRRKRRRP